VSTTTLVLAYCLVVVTGSGIGPCLGQILAARVPARPTTLRVVGELERLGIPAFGPIWDS
jgi:hypothetical protein